MCRSAKQVTVSSAKSFALQCKQIAILCKKTRYFPRHKLMALLRFICGIFMCRSAKQVAYSSAKSFALQCKQIDVFMQKNKIFSKA